MLHRGEVLGELYFLEYLRGAPGIPELEGAWPDADGVSYVVEDAGETYVGRDAAGAKRFGKFVARNAFEAARALLDCFRSFSEVGGFFLDDLSAHQFSYRTDPPAVFIAARGVRGSFSHSPSSSSQRPPP